MIYLGLQKIMANRKRFIRALSDAERGELEKAFKHGIKHRERQRAQAVLLSASGHEMNSLAARFGVNPDTINRWRAAGRNMGWAACGKGLTWAARRKSRARPKKKVVSTFE